MIPSIFGGSALGWVATMASFGVVILAVGILTAVLYPPLWLLEWALGVFQKAFA
jgi:hypothetical protein